MLFMNWKGIKIIRKKPDFLVFVGLESSGPMSKN